MGIRVWFGSTENLVLVPEEVVDMLSPILSARRAENLASVARDHIQIPDNPPKMVLIVGPSRTGTTALSNVFARLGVPAYMQPIKSMRRAVDMAENVINWEVDRYASLVVSKETLGPRTEAEFFDPAEELLKIGYPEDKIYIIGVLREPRATLASWVSMWGKVPMQGLIKSYQLIDHILSNAQRRGEKVTYYVHEAISANDPGVVTGKLFERVGISIVENVHLPREERLSDFVDWRSGPIFGESGSNIIFFDSPPGRFIKGVKEGKGYHFRYLVAELTEGQEKALRENGIYEIYKKFASECERNLQIPILERK